MHLSLPCTLCWLLLLTKLVTCSTSINSSFDIAKPGCASRCGAVIIPYPFGIGSNCSFNSWFNISCNASSHPPSVLLSTTGYRLNNISPSNISVRIPYISSNCYYNAVPRSNGFTLPLNFSNSPFSLSGTNMLTSFGCSDIIVLEGKYRRYQGQDFTEQTNFTNGCVSFCTAEFDGWSNVYCPGSSCCQIPIPDGTVFLNVSVSDVQDKLGATAMRKTFSGSKPCSYSYLGSRGKFAAGSGYMPQLLMSSYGSLPIILDWRFGTESCKEATSNSTSFACGPNTICIDPKPMQGGYYAATQQGFGGYRCVCKKGYEGNPYLPQGCTDIDECIYDTSCHPMASCINRPGSYTCVCREGYYGDGMRDGMGCFGIPQPLHSKLSILAIGLISGAGLMVLLSMSFGLTKFARKKKNQKQRQKFFKQNGGLLLQQEKPANEGILRKTRIFTAKDLERATDRFNESRILGHGGQGTVYKGMLSDGKIVAVKKSKLAEEKMSKRLVEQFVNEVVILSQINHKNVVKLLGCCLETRTPLLVYEFMPNGTLCDLIHGTNIEFPVSWTMRLKIAADVAGALAYLHSATSVAIFHRDIKSSNILLDEKFVAKISDFGTSKSVEVDQTHLTTGVNGTFGYIDPEYFQSYQFTNKSDVYSFGVVLVELLTGLKPILASTDMEDGKSLVSHFLSAMKDDTLETIIESQVSEEGEKKEILAVAELAKRCLSLTGKKRPYMKEVAMELEAVRKCDQIKISDDDDAMEMQEDCIFSRGLLMIENSEYSWTNTDQEFGSSSSDVQPLKFITN